MNSIAYTYHQFLQDVRTVTLELASELSWAERREMEAAPITLDCAVHQPDLLAVLMVEGGTIWGATNAWGDNHIAIFADVAVPQGRELVAATLVHELAHVPYAKDGHGSGWSYLSQRLGMANEPYRHGINPVSPREQWALLKPELQERIKALPAITDIADVMARVQFLRDNPEAIDNYLHMHNGNRLWSCTKELMEDNRLEQMDPTPTPANNAERARGPRQSDRSHDFVNYGMDDTQITAWHDYRRNLRLAEAYRRYILDAGSPADNNYYRMRIEEVTREATNLKLRYNLPVWRMDETPQEG